MTLQLRMGSSSSSISSRPSSRLMPIDSSLRPHSDGPCAVGAAPGWWATFYEHFWFNTKCSGSSAGHVNAHIERQLLRPPNQKFNVTGTKCGRGITLDPGTTHRCPCCPAARESVSNLTLYGRHTCGHGNVQDNGMADRMQEELCNALKWTSSMLIYSALAKLSDQHWHLNKTI